MVQEGEGFALTVGFQPQGNPAQLDRERILVHAVDTVCHHIADRFPHPFRRRLLFAGADAGKFFAETSGSRKEEMTRPARRVTDADGKEGLFGE